MPNHRPFRALLSGALAAAGLVVLVGCTSAGAAPNPSAEATPAPSPSAEAPAPDPTPTALDPADVTTWVITAQGIGPIVRGADAAETVAGFTAFEANEWCPGVIGLSQEGTGQIVVTVLDDGTVGAVWANGRDVGDGTVPPSPSTEEGIVFGSTMEELAAAYPGLVPSNQAGAESYGYAAGDETAGYLNFLVEGDKVISIGVQDRAGVPKEFCG
ncbi:hypothetical protein ACFVTX_06860 [Agromyces sp. NPDC058136]|uniref:hypothetical protein n=1 Tax=Agromyces sp. NPDC058136 TaxID=3346354 RepID=UPI0036DF60CD